MCTFRKRQKIGKTNFNSVACGIELHRKIWGWERNRERGEKLEVE
jgi:hypothetical protein